MLKINDFLQKGSHPEQHMQFVVAKIAADFLLFSEIRSSWSLANVYQEALSEMDTVKNKVVAFFFHKNNLLSDLKQPKKVHM